MDSTLDDLKDTQSVLNWDVTDIRKHVKVDRLVEKFKERLEEKDTGQTWKALNILLFLSYEKLLSKNQVFDTSYLRHGEEIIQCELWVRKHNKAAQHVLYSSWAHIYLKMGNLKSAVNCISKVKPYNKLSNQDKAFVLALKACFFMMYGPPGNEEAAKFLTEVLILEQDEPEWYYIKGKCLSRMRRLHYRSKPTYEELALFKKAVAMRPECARYLIHLARSKADLASAVRHNRKSLKDLKVLQALETDVESLLSKAVKFSVESPHLICHIAKSIMKLSHYFRMRNLELTQYCVRKAMEISPSDALVNHTVGLYHLTQGDIDDAVYFLTEASNMGVYGASFDLCRLKWRECRGYDPVPDLMEVVENNDDFAASESHCLLATYYFFVKNDLLSAVKHWKQWLHCRDKEEYSISSCFLGQESFDFNCVLFDEVRLELSLSRCNPEDRVKLEEASAIIRENRPELEGTEPWRQRQHLIDKAQMVSRIGRAFPDSIGFLHKEQRAKRKNRPFGLKEVTKKNGKKMCVSSKYNAFSRGRQKKGDADKDKTRTLSEGRVIDRRSKEKPFWQPMKKRHGSVGNLNKTSSNRDGNLDKTSWNSVGNLNKTSSNSVGNLDKTSLKTVGSGRVTPSFESDRLKVRAASVETLLLLKSYEKSCNKNDRSSFGPRRFGSQESVASDASGRSSRGRNTFSMGSRSMSSEQVSRNRQSSSDRESFRTSGPGDRSFGRSRNSSSSEADPPRSWRRGENTGQEQENPRSSYFQSFSSIDAMRPSSRSSSVAEGDSVSTSRPSSRSSMDWEDDSRSTFFSRNNRGQGDGFGPSSRSAMGREDDPRSSFFSRNNRGQGDGFGPSSRSAMGREDDPRSSFFSRNNRGQGDGFGPSSRSAMGREDDPRSSFFSRNNRGQGDGFGPSSRSAMGREDDPRSSFLSRNNRGQGFVPPTRSSFGNEGRSPFSSSQNNRSQNENSGQENSQSSSRGRGNYVPRGGSFSRGGQLSQRGRGLDASRSDFENAFRRLNLKK